MQRSAEIRVHTLMTGLSRACRRAAAALVVGSAVASCAVADDRQTATAPTATPIPAARAVPIDRVLYSAFRAIEDRYIETPDFRRLSTEAYRSLALTDPSLKLDPGERSFRVLQGDRLVVERATPGPADGRAWATMLGELVDASIKASPALTGAERERLLKAAMDGVTRQLDRNTRYADPDEARDNRFMRDGAGGIGVTLEADGEETVIKSLQDGGPAERAGIRPDDRIVSVDGKRMVGLPLRDVVRSLRGRVGDSVSIVVRRPSESRQASFEFRREQVIPTTVTVERRDGGLALIRLSGFNSASTENMRKAIRRLRDEAGAGLAGIVLDMRGNPGGLLDQAVSIADLFLDEGIVATTQGRHGDSRQSFRSGGGADLRNVPIVVLMNGRSASAAEILGAALQDRGRALVVGSTSFGKGSVQTVVRLPNEGELVLTWSRLYAPSGYTWNELGVLPSVCTSKYGDPAQLGAQLEERLATMRMALAQWHAVRNPTIQQVQDLRTACPPTDQSAEKDLDIAERLLKDRALYARAVKASTEAIAQQR